MSGKAINILVLGETGVGKSTWINSFANYARFKTLDDAIAAEPVCLIPTKFSICDENYEDRVIHFGESSNECMVDGQSGTQAAMAHVFQMQNGETIRLIDTPGIADARGPDQDNKNLDYVLRYISRYPEIHGICFLFRSNQPVLTVAFRYAVNELLTHLHRNAASNIVLCFTNARASFYRPGETLRILRVFCEELNDKHGVNIRLSDNTMFCMDNEAFRFLLAHKNGINFTKEDFEEYKKSWARSQSVTEAIVNQIKRLQPHQSHETVSINNARRIILAIAKPMADITNNIQLNKKLLEDHKEDLLRHSGTYDDLLTKVRVTQTQYRKEDLGYPRTVCTECVYTVNIPNTNAKQTIYNTHCHPHCYLEGVAADKVPNPDLQKCAAMDGSLNCTNCSCTWNYHMHITYAQILDSVEVDDPLVRDAIDKNLGEKQVKEAAINTSETRLAQLEIEHKTSLEAGAKFGAYLAKNSIKPYNDAIDEYLQYSIKEEERLIAAGKTNHVKLEIYRKNRAVYQQEKDILDRAIKAGTTEVTTGEIMNLVDTLKRLPINGPTYSDLFDAALIGETKNMAFSENHYDPKTGAYTNGNDKKQNFTARPMISTFSRSPPPDPSSYASVPSGSSASRPGPSANPFDASELVDLLKRFFQVQGNK